MQLARHVVHLQFYLVTLGRTKDCLKLLAWIFLVVTENYCMMKFQTSLMSVKKRKTNTQNYLIGWKHNQNGLVRKCHRCIDKQTLIKRQYYCHCLINKCETPQRSCNYVALHRRRGGSIKLAANKK